MIVGEASIVITPDMALFGPELDAKTKAGLAGFKKNSEIAGAEAGASLRSGVGREAGKLGDDLEHAGTKGGERLSKGLSGGLSKAAGLLSSVGLPLGGLASGFEKAGSAAEHMDTKSSGLMGTLDKLGGVALVGVGAATAGVAAESIHLAEGMETADTSIANAEHTGSSFAKTVGDSFLKTGASAEFTGKQMAAAFGEVAGQLKATEGHVLSVSESYEFMRAASDLAEAKQIELGEATKATAGILQTFKLSVGEATHVTDVLYSTSTATGVGVGALGTQLEKIRSKLGESAGSVGELSSLLVDMKDQGISGRGALAGLNGAMSTLQATATGTGKATAQQDAAFRALTPGLQLLVKQYESGTISNKEFKKVTGELPPAQAQLVAAFTKAQAAAQAAQAKYKEMGVTVFDAQGKFVGMGSIIDQLAPRFAKMSNQQQRATAETLFGKSAAEQMTAVLRGGSSAYSRASQEVERHGTAQSAAAKQAKTLHGEEKELSKDAINLATSFGQILIPVVTKLVGAIATASTFVLAHKVVLIGLAAVVTGVLGTAIAVFTVNKMVAFGQSFAKASGVVKQFASDVAGMVSKVVAQFGIQEAATEKLAATTAEQSGQMELDFETTGASSKLAAEEIAGSATAVEQDVGAEAAAVSKADGDIATANATAGGSFAALASAAGPIVLATAAMYGFNKAEEAVRKHWGFLGEVIDKFANGVTGMMGAAEENLTTGKKIDEVLFGGSHNGGGSGAKGPTGADVNAATSGESLRQQAEAAAEAAAKKYGIPANILKADIEQESDYREVTSSAGARGLTQFIPSTAARYGVKYGTTPEDIVSQIMGQAHYLADLGGRKNIKYALEGYLGEHGPQGATYAASVLSKAGATPAHTQATKDNTAALKELHDLLAKGEAGETVKTNGKTLHAKANPLHEGNYGFFEAAGTNYKQGVEPIIAHDLAKLGEALHLHLTGVSGYRTPAHSVAVGGFANDPHTRGEASDTPGTERISESVLNKFGLTRPFAGAKEADHIQLSAKGLQEAAQAVTKGGLGLSAAGAKMVIEAAATLKREEQKRSADQKAGTKALNTLVAAQNSSSLKSLNAALGKAHKEGVGQMVKDVHGIHEKHMGSLERTLDADHTKALAKLSQEIMAAHKKALEHQAELVAKAAKEAYEKSIPGQVAAWEKGNKERRELEEAEARSPEGRRLAAEKAAEQAAADQLKAQEGAERAQVEAITRQATLASDIAANTVTEIGDATKVTLDKQAEAGLSGTAEISAHLQTVYDELTGNMDKAIGQAKIAQDEAAGKGAIAEAEAAARTSRIEAEAKVKEAQAQQTLELAKATAAKGSSAGPGINIENLTIVSPNGNPSEIMGAFGWELKTGALPLAQATPVIPA